MADVISRAEHATAKYRLPRCDSTLLFITPFPDSLPRLSGAPSPPPPLETISPFPSFFLFPRRVRIVDGVVCRRSRFSCETKRDTPPAIHIKWRNLIERRYSPRGVETEAVHRFLSLLFLFHSCGDCGEEGGDRLYRLPGYLESIGEFQRKTHIRGFIVCAEHDLDVSRQRKPYVIRSTVNYRRSRS